MTKTNNTTEKNAAQAPCSCQCPAGECRCQETNCQCGCQAPASGR